MGFVVRRGFNPLFEARPSADGDLAADGIARTEPSGESCIEELCRRRTAATHDFPGIHAWAGESPPSSICPPWSRRTGAADDRQAKASSGRSANIVPESSVPNTIEAKSGAGGAGGVKPQHDRITCRRQDYPRRCTSRHQRLADAPKQRSGALRRRGSEIAWQQRRGVVPAPIPGRSGAISAQFALFHHLIHRLFSSAVGGDRNGPRAWV